MGQHSWIAFSYFNPKSLIAVRLLAPECDAAIDAGKEAYVAEKRKNESKAISEGRPSYPVDDAENK